MEETSMDVVLHPEERLFYFPWITKVNKKFSKCFPSDYNEETLDFFHREIEKELEAISICSATKNKALFETLLCFYNHFCWKIKWKKPSPHMKSSCAKILSYICKVGLVLSKGNVQSKWIKQVLSAVKVFPGDNDYLYDALLQIYKINKKNYCAYAAVLRHVLSGPQPKTENPCTFFKLMLLYRRLKFQLQNSYEKAQVDTLAAAVAIPHNLMSWLADNGLEDIVKAMKKNKMIIMKKKFSNEMLIKLREVVIHDAYTETTSIMEGSEVNQFSIDRNPETLNDNWLLNSLNVDDDIVKEQEAEVGTSMSKRKSPNESNKGSATKKRKKIELDNKLKDKRTSIKDIALKVDVPEITISYMDMALDSNTPSKSKKKLKKKTNVNQVKVDEISLDISSVNEDSKIPVSTNVDEIEDSLCIQSYTNAIQSIEKGKKKRNTINIPEELNPKDIENDPKIYEDHVQSVKKSKKKRKTINNVEDIVSKDNKKNTGIGETGSMSTQPTKKTLKNKTSIHVAPENSLVVNDKSISSSKKGKKRKSINIAQENNLNVSENESDTNISLYVQSTETGKNRRKTINSMQTISEKDIDKDLLGVSTSKKGKKKRQTINIAQEVNPKYSEYQSNFNDNYSLYTPPVTNQTDSSLIPGNDSKINNKKRKNSHFTSADFIVTPIENAEIVSKEGNTKRSTKKNEWIVTANDDLETISSTAKTPPEKHRFKVSEMNDNGSFEKVTIDNVDNNSITSRDIIKPSAMKSTSESELNNIEDEEAESKNTVSESETVDTNEEAESADTTEIIKPKITKFAKETESIVSTNDKGAAISEDEESNEDVSDTQSGDTDQDEFSDETKPTTKVVRFVEKRNSSTSANEMEEFSSEDEEANESLSETESAITTGQVESTHREKIITKLVNETKSIASTNKMQVTSNENEEAGNLSKTGSVDTTDEAESSECTVEMNIMKPIAKVVKFVEETESIVSANELETGDSEDADDSVSETPSVDTTRKAECLEDIGSIDEPNKTDSKFEEAVKNGATKSEEDSAVGFVKTVAKIDLIKNAETFKSVPDTEEKIGENVKTNLNENTVDVIEETKHINSTIEIEDFESEAGKETADKTKSIVIVKETETVDFMSKTYFEPVPETEETLNNVEIITGIDAVHTIEETEDVGSVSKLEDFEPIPETDEGMMKDKETIADTDAVHTIEETEDVGSVSKLEDFEPIPETDEEMVKDVETIADTNAAKTVEHTINEGSMSKSEDFDLYSRQEENTIDIVEHSEAFEIIEGPKDNISTNEIGDFEPIPETEEGAMEDVETIADTNTVNTIEETVDVCSLPESKDFEPIPETEDGSMKDVDTIANTNTVNTIEETVDVCSLPKSKDFEPIPETEGVIKGVETITDANAANTIEKTVDEGSLRKLEDFNPNSHPEENTVDIVENSEAFELIVELKENNSTNEMVEGSEEMDKSDETKDTDNIIKMEEFELIDEITDEEPVDMVEEPENTETPCTVEETTMDLPKSAIAIDIVDTVKDRNVIESSNEMKIKSVSEPKALDINEDIDIKSSGKMETLELVIDTNATKCIETDKTLIQTKGLNTGGVQPIDKAENVESTNKTEIEDSDEYLEIIESTDDKTEAEETDEQLENDGTQCSSEITESELDTSISKYNYLVKEIFCDGVSDDSVRESMSPNKKNSIDSISSENVMSPTSNTEKLKNNISSSTNNCEASTENNENVPIESGEIEEEASIFNTQHYCKLLLKEVTDDNLEEDFDAETKDQAKNIVEKELPGDIPIHSSSGDSKDDSQAKYEEHSSTKMDISTSHTLDETALNSEKVLSKETETVESIAEGLYKKLLKAKKERLSLTSSVPEEKANAILTENTVSYVIGKVIEKVEDVTANDQSSEILKNRMKFTPERCQIPKLGNLSNLKPFGFPDEKSQCLSFVDFSKDKCEDSTEIEGSKSCLQTKEKNFYPYRNLTIEVPDDKSESNFSDLVVDEKLEETICVPVNEDSSDDETEIDEDLSQSPICNSKQNVEESLTNEECQSAKTHISPKLNEVELENLVRSMKVPIVNLGRKCDDIRFEEISQNDGVASSQDENKVLSTEKRNVEENIVGSQSEKMSQESTKKENEDENTASKNETVITTRKLRQRNVSSPVMTDKSTLEEKPKISSRTRSRRKPSNQDTLKGTGEALTDLRRSTRRLRNEFQGLRLDSPKRFNPINEDTTDQNVDSEANANSKRLTTPSTAAKRKGSTVPKTDSEENIPLVEAEDGETDSQQTTSKNSSTRKRATRSTAATNKITKYFSTETKDALAPVKETDSENQDSAETENLPTKKRFTRSNAFAIVKEDSKTRLELVDAKEVAKDSISGDAKSKKSVPKRSTRAATRGASKTKLSQNTPADEESDLEDLDSQSNVSEESHKENVADEDEPASKAAESSAKEYNLRRSTRNLIRPSRFKLSQDNF